MDEDKKIIMSSWILKKKATPLQAQIWGYHIFNEIKQNANNSAIS